MISEELIVKESGQYDPEIIQRLRLMNQGLKQIGYLDRCHSLIDLNLSRNEISAISGLETLLSLKRLDLSYNRIRKIENVQHLSSLEYLDLKGNYIASVNDIMELQLLSELKSLFLKGADGNDPNPACQHPSYVTIVMRTLPQLQIIDGGHLHINEAFQSLEEHLAYIQPDAAACTTPPLNPWLDGNEMQAALAVGDDAIINTDNNSSSSGSDLDSFLKSSRVYREVFGAHEQLQEVLSEECAHLLRKAQTAISKASKS